MATRVPYESSGRVHQKGRTRAALIEATRALLGEGITPTVEQAADRAAVSRTTAYRYFVNQRELLLATYPELEMATLLGPDAPGDPLERLDRVTAHIAEQLVAHEPELRASLRLTLESEAPVPLRQGRALAWIEDALRPARLPKLRHVAIAVRVAIGIEPLVWLTGIAGLTTPEAIELMRESARTLASAAIRAAARRGASRAAPGRRHRPRGARARYLRRGAGTGDYRAGGRSLRA